MDPPSPGPPPAANMPAPASQRRAPRPPLLAFHPGGASAGTASTSIESDPPPLPTSPRTQHEHRLRHVWEPADRDPHYDYDHRVAHGHESLGRWRSLSLGTMHDAFNAAVGGATSASDSSHAATVSATSPLAREWTNMLAAGSNAAEEVRSLDRTSSCSSTDTTAGDGPALQLLATAPVFKSTRKPVRIIEDHEKHRLRRRASHDEKTMEPRQFIIDVDSVQRQILQQEDTDGDSQITVTDSGPKLIPLGTLQSRGHNKFEVRGHYALANLLQELALASDHGRRHIVLDEGRIHENPVTRLSRMIQHHFWDGLTRRIDAAGLELICLDPKNRSGSTQPRIYVPKDDLEALEYYRGVAADRPHLRLDVVQLPSPITPEYVKSINDRPGILSLALRKTVDAQGVATVRGVPFVVPGGRFNEMYGWDSYFETLGLLVDGRFELSRSMVDNFCYEIEHYGKILNANRSYYLTRSQPPYLTDMILKVYEKFPVTWEASAKNQWLLQSVRAAIKEYNTVWMVEPRYVPHVGLSRYHPEGLGVPPETEESHFHAVLRPYATKYSLDIHTFVQRFNNREIIEPALDEYFLHDRAVRESGHDTTYRLEGKCAHICPVDLNCLLYRYEVDIHNIILKEFDNALLMPDGSVETSEPWLERAQRRKELLNHYCWNDDVGMYFDYDIQQKRQNDYESVTTFYALWAGVATQEQARRMVDVALQKFETQGGLVTGTEKSRGELGLDRPNRQWDYPYGWAPLQIIAWRGLFAYGFEDVTRRLAYRWLYMITKAFVDFNGVVPEKFDTVTLNHRLNVEYGNVGVDFKFIPREGFGWMNSSYEVGLTYMTSHMRRALGTLVHPDAFFSKKNTTGAPKSTLTQSLSSPASMS